jgi:NADH-quinone oxidoreductase subunit M
MPFISGCFVIGCMASVGVPGTVNFIAEVMIIVGSWNKYPLQVIVAVVGIVLTLAYLFKMMRGLFYGPMDQKYSHAHDAVAVVDRLPLMIMITVSIGFFFFPMHLYNVVRSGVDPLIAKITRVVPIAASGAGFGTVPEETGPVETHDAHLLANNPITSRGAREPQ